MHGKMQLPQVKSVVPVRHGTCVPNTVQRNLENNPEVDEPMITSEGPRRSHLHVHRMRCMGSMACQWSM